MTYSGSTLATGAGTVIAITSILSGNVQSFPAAEWASFAARYQQYRVKAIRLTAKAVNPVQTSTTTHSILYMGDYLGVETPGSAAQLLSDERVRTTSTDKDFSYTVTWSRNPNAKLWTGVGVAIPAINQYAIVVGTPAAPALTTALTYYAYVVEWEVEFRGSQ
jgi:hypothetical protein